MSTDIVNRQRVLKILPQIQKYVGLNFVQCFIVSTIVKNTPQIYYVGTPQVQYLANNHRVWPNYIWRDYNHHFLNYLGEIGYDQDEVQNMRQVQRVYEKAEKITRQPVLNRVYDMLRPAISLYRYVKDKSK